MGNDAVAVGIGDRAAVEDRGAVHGHKGHHAVMDVEFTASEGIDARTDGVRAVAALGNVDLAVNAGEGSLLHRVHAEAAPVAVGKHAVFKILVRVVDHVVQAGIAVYAETLRGLAHARADRVAVFVILARVADEFGIIHLEPSLAAGEGHAAHPAGNRGLRIAHDQGGAVGRAQRRALSHKVVAAAAGELDIGISDLYDRTAAGADGGEPVHVLGADHRAVHDDLCGLRGGSLAGCAALGDLTGGESAQHGLPLLQAVLCEIENGGKLGGEIHVLVGLLVLVGLKDGIDHIHGHSAVIISGLHDDVHAAHGQIRALPLTDGGGVLRSVGNVHDLILMVGYDSIFPGRALQIAVQRRRLAGRFTGRLAGRLSGRESRNAETQKHGKCHKQSQELLDVLHAFGSSLM